MDRPIRVLIVEDAADDALLMVHALRNGGYDPAFEVVDTPEAMAAALDKQTWDVVLADYVMPHFSAPAALKLLQTRDLDVPFIVVSGNIGEDVAVEAMKTGANDYLMKDNMARLASAVEREAREATGRRKRRQAEGSLRASQEYAGNIIDCSLDMIITVDMERKITEFNRAAEQTFGYRREEVLGRHVSMLYADEDEGLRVHSTTMENGRCVQEVANRRKNGEIFPGMLSASILRNAQGGPVGAMGISRDITDRKRAEDVLRNSQEDLKRQVRRQDALLWVNQAVQEMTQPADLERVIQVCDEQLKKSGLNFEALAIQRLIDEASHTFEFHEIQPSGTYDRFSTSNANLHRIWRSAKVLYRPDLETDMGGLTPDDMEMLYRRYGLRIRCILNVPHVLGLLSLLSARPTAFSESDIRFIEQVSQVLSVGISRVEDLEHLAGLVRFLPEGICLVDGARRLVFANPAAQQYLDCLGGLRVGDVISRIGRTDFAHFLLPAAGGLPHEVRLDGPPPCVFEVTTSPVREEIAGGGWTLVIRDVTQEREAEQKIQTQQRLAAVGQMAAGIAHDFNNLLTVMSGFAQMLVMREDIPDSAKEELRSIFEQGQRAAQLIRQILDFSRQSDTERQSMDLLPFLKEMSKLMTRTLPETIRVMPEFDEGIYEVNANPAQLQQVFANLAVNARDAMPEGGVLTFGLSRLRVEEGAPLPMPNMAPGDWAVWTVSDTGVGIPPEVLAHMYEPFFTTKQPDKGTGLGLAQVYGLVEQHGGTIDVESREGEGAVFRIYLPLVAVAEETSRQADVSIPKGHGETVLLVEDEADVLFAARAMLEHLNYGVRTASCGREALEVFDAHRDEIRLVLTDVVMPQMGGPELAGALWDKGARIPVIFVSGYAPDEMRQRKLPGVAGYIQKPLLMQPLAQALQNALGAGEAGPCISG